MKKWFVGASLVVAVVLLASGWRTLAADKAEAGESGPAAYTVVATDGSHLIVTNNREGKLYFYAIGPEDKIGDPLQLRGVVDLSQVGKPVITPTTYKKK